MNACGLAVFAVLLAAPPLAAQTQSRVVEEIAARVNNEIITKSDVERARARLLSEVNEDCRDCTPAQREEMLRDREKHLLRDLIDQSLLTQRAKDAGFNVETQLVKQIDEIRRRNNMATQEEFERAVTQATGQAFEDWKANIRNQMLTQEIIRREVAGEIRLDPADVRKYYDEHKKEFDRPDKVYLSEIFVSTEGKPAEEIPNLEKKAKELLQMVREGGNFEEIARRMSEGTTAERGGDLGGFERGQLSGELEEQVFKMNRGQITDVIRTQTGFLILRVDERYEKGLQPMEKVEGEITNRLYNERMPDALRKYLTRLREESYVLVKPGYSDTAEVATMVIEEVQPPPPEDQEKDKKGKGKKNRGKKEKKEKDAEAPAKPSR